MVYAAVSQFRCAAARGILGPRVPTAVIRLARSFSSLLKQSRAGDAFAGLLSARHSLALLMLGTLAYAQFPAAPPSMSLRMQVYVFYVFRRLFGRLFLLRIGRNAEFEADRLALHYQYASGYDPAQFVRQNTFSGAQREVFFARLLDEHPPTQTRIKRSEEAIRHYCRPKDYTVDTDEFRSSQSQRSRCNESRQPRCIPRSWQNEGP
jgi:predicted Zn-dependent protease